VDVDASMCSRGEDVEIAVPMFRLRQNGCYLCVNVVQFSVGHWYYGEVISEFRHECGLYYVSVFFDRKFIVAEEVDQYFDLSVEEVFCVMP
jgi:hypothetical protein